MSELTSLKGISNFIFICLHITWKTNISNEKLYQIKLDGQIKQKKVFSKMSSGLGESSRESRESR